MKQTIKTIRLIACIAFFLTLTTSHSKLSAQTLWGKIYDNYYDKQEAKGNYSPSQDGFIVTGHSQTSFNKNLTYLLETNQNGSVTWQTYIGDTLYHFLGESVIESSDGYYVVVGKTTKDQADTTYDIDSCPSFSPYFNAFIAFINRDSSTLDWCHIFGDMYLHDEAVEVLEDQNGDFVVTGTASGRLSIDTCGIHSANYACPVGYDQSGVLLTKFDASGNMLFNEVISDYRYDRGVSVIEDPLSQTYLILVNRRDSSQNGLNRPLVLVTDYNGIFQSATEYDPQPNLEKISKEIVKYRDGYVIVGNVEDNNGNLNNSFFMDLDGGLNLMNYGTLQHPYLELLVKDVLVDNDTLVVSGNAILADSSTEVKLLLKLDISMPFRQFVLLALSGTNNITHYASYLFEDNTNFCFYPYTDDAGYDHNGYHLFGNSSDYYFDHVKTDYQTISLCYEMDSIGIENTLLAQMQVTLDEDYLSDFEEFELIESSIFEFQECDTIDLYSAPFAETLDVRFISPNSQNIYPNPFSEQLNIRNENAASFSYSVLNTIGDIICEGFVSEGIKTIQTADWKQGLYIVNLKNEASGMNYNRKLIKF